MALLLATAITGGGVILFQHAKDLMQSQSMRQARAEAEADQGYELAMDGPIQHFSKVFMSADAVQGRFRRYYKTVDERGAPCYFVDYGDHAWTKQYSDPTKQLV